MPINGLYQINDLHKPSRFTCSPNTTSLPVPQEPFGFQTNGGEWWPTSGGDSKAGEMVLDAEQTSWCGLQREVAAMHLSMPPGEPGPFLQQCCVCFYGFSWEYILWCVKREWRNFNPKSVLFSQLDFWSFKRKIEAKFDGNLRAPQQSLRQVPKKTAEQHASSTRRAGLANP